LEVIQFSKRRLGFDSSIFAIGFDGSVGIQKLNHAQSPVILHD